MADSAPIPPPQSAAASCPICHLATSFSVENRYRPFCSSRCQLVDLGNWLDERYVVPGAHKNPTTEASPAAAPDDAAAGDSAFVIADDVDELE